MGLQSLHLSGEGFVFFIDIFNLILLSGLILNYKLLEMPGRPKGIPKTGGRQKGTPNKTTEEARKAFQKIMAGQVGNVQTALQEIYKEDKKQFLYVLSKYFPYFLPRQEHIDISNEDGSLAVNNNFNIEFRESNPDTAAEV